MHSVNPLRQNYQPASSFLNLLPRDNDVTFFMPVKIFLNVLFSYDCKYKYCCAFSALTLLVGWKGIWPVDN